MVVYDWTTIGQFYIDNNLRADRPLTLPRWSDLCSLKPFLNLSEKPVDDLIDNPTLETNFQRSAKKYLGSEVWLHDTPRGFKLPTPEVEADRTKPSQALAVLWKKGHSEHEEERSSPTPSTPTLSILTPAMSTPVAPEAVQPDPKDQLISQLAEDKKRLEEKVRALGEEYNGQLVEAKRQLDLRVQGLEEKLGECDDANTVLKTRIDAHAAREAERSQQQQRQQATALQAQADRIGDLERELAQQKSRSKTELENAQMVWKQHIDTWEVRYNAARQILQTEMDLVREDKEKLLRWRQELRQWGTEVLVRLGERVDGSDAEDGE